MENPDFRLIAVAIILCLASNTACSHWQKNRSALVGRSKPPSTHATRQNGELLSPEELWIEPAVESEIGKIEAEQRADLMRDAELAIAETRSALAALGQSDRSAALSALERANGSLNAILSREHNSSFAPIDVSTSMIDLYASPEMVKRVVNDAKDDLARGRVQDARQLVSTLASEADVNVVGIPLNTYPAEIRAVAPMIEAGRLEEAKAALTAALHTLAVKTYIIPLPGLRAEALIVKAEQFASNPIRQPDETNELQKLLKAARTEVQLAEALGYGNTEDYNALYAQLDDVQKRTENGYSNRGLLNGVERSLKSLDVSSWR